MGRNHPGANESLKQSLRGLQVIRLEVRLLGRSGPIYEARQMAEFDPKRTITRGDRIAEKAREGQNLANVGWIGMEDDASRASGAGAADPAAAVLAQPGSRGRRRGDRQGGSLRRCGTDGEAH